MQIAQFFTSLDPFPLATAVIATINLCVALYLASVFVRNYREFRSRLTARLSGVGTSMVVYNGAFLSLFLTRPVLWHGEICMSLLMVSIVQLMGLGLFALVASE